LSADDLSADAVRGKLNELLVNPRYRLAAQRIGEEMASMPTPRAVADAFTQLQSLPQAQLE
jgi:UDP:flavonoid glycosyltransferase YjiC (YdhE family)